MRISAMREYRAQVSSEPMCGDILVQYGLNARFILLPDPFYQGRTRAEGYPISNMLEVMVLGYCKQHGIAADNSQLPAKPPVAAKKKRVPA